MRIRRYEEAVDCLPGGPCIHATSGDSKAKRTASFWLVFNDSSKDVKFCTRIFSEGEERPRSTRSSGDAGGEGFS